MRDLQGVIPPEEDPVLCSPTMDLTVAEEEQPSTYRSILKGYSEALEHLTHSEEILPSFCSTSSSAAWLGDSGQCTRNCRSPSVITGHHRWHLQGWTMGMMLPFLQAKAIEKWSRSPKKMPGLMRANHSRVIGGRYVCRTDAELHCSRWILRNSCYLLQPNVLEFKTKEIDHPRIRSEGFLSNKKACSSRKQSYLPRWSEDTKVFWRNKMGDSHRTQVSL